MKLGNSPLKFKNPPFGISPPFFWKLTFSPQNSSFLKLAFPPFKRGERKLCYTTHITETIAFWDGGSTLTLVSSQHKAICEAVSINITLRDFASFWCYWHSNWKQLCTTPSRQESSLSRFSTVREPIWYGENLGRCSQRHQRVCEY